MLVKDREEKTLYKRTKTYLWWSNRRNMMRKTGEGKCCWKEDGEDISGALFSVGKIQRDLNLARYVHVSLSLCNIQTFYAVQILAVSTSFLLFRGVSACSLQFFLFHVVSISQGCQVKDFPRTYIGALRHEYEGGQWTCPNRSSLLV